MLTPNQWFGFLCNSDTDADFISTVRKSNAPLRQCPFTLNDVCVHALMGGTSTNAFFLSERLNDISATTMTHETAKYDILRALIPENLADAEEALGTAAESREDVRAAYLQIVKPNLPAKSDAPFDFDRKGLKHFSKYAAHFLEEALKDVRETRGGTYKVSLGRNKMDASVFCLYVYGHAMANDAIATIMAHCAILMLRQRIEAFANFESLLRGTFTAEYCNRNACDFRRARREVQALSSRCPIETDAFLDATYAFVMHREALLRIMHPSLNAYMRKVAEDAHASLATKAATTTAEQLSQTNLTDYGAMQLRRAVVDFVEDAKLHGGRDFSTATIMMRSTGGTSFDYAQANPVSYAVTEIVVDDDLSVDAIVHIVHGAGAVKVLMPCLLALWKMYKVRSAYLLSVGGHAEPGRQMLYARYGFNSFAFASPSDNWRTRAAAKVFRELIDEDCGVDADEFGSRVTTCGFNMAPMHVSLKRSHPTQECLMRMMTESNVNCGDNFRSIDDLSADFDDSEVADRFGKQVFFDSTQNVQSGPKRRRRFL